MSTPTSTRPQTAVEQMMAERAQRLSLSPASRRVYSNLRDKGASHAVAYARAVQGMTR